MTRSRTADGSAGDADYGRIGGHYADYRRPDARIAAAIVEALATAQSVVNIGAGAGSYEPADRSVTAVEPSASMRAQRPSHLPPAVDAVAEELPFADASFDAAMTTFSVHQWPDLAAGLREMRRVATGPVVILTCDPALLDRFWLAEYAPEVIATEARRYPTPDAIAEHLGGHTTVRVVPIPLDCTDGFNEAYYGRPEMLLDPAARKSCSAWSFVAPDRAAAYTEALRTALDDGSWDRRYGHLRTQPTYDGSLVLVVNTPERRAG
ncbi:class I SAM-dependent methyltransferase [Kutzneria buriramensis]|uniref:Ubiquinone/menaquinone biosynthesis C-methylase UbiE n=1 Tax=Kutzneria buriramensis TaxID=1045776 RepID=A0A3E0HDM4_9PSEU|nr:class I SAM-dependent methyltransferase [Kutzneria buriramensis]REH42904.1 ubiquinone/menaquinone biosynthesis C-methylase UbiE [Kutzneria buriramensis]